jgi:predicted HAD superfamily Cof-like phosphohydrolase
VFHVSQSKSIYTAKAKIELYRDEFRTRRRKTQEMAREVQLSLLELREHTKTSRSTSFAVAAAKQTQNRFSSRFSLINLMLLNRFIIFIILSI